MANIRSLKKDIDFVMTLVLQDCFTLLENNPETGREKVMEIAQKVLSDHADLRSRVTHHSIRNQSGKPGKYLSGVVEDMYALAGNSLDQLAAIVKNENI